MAWTLLPSWIEGTAGEGLELLRRQCAVFILVHFRKTFEYSRQLLFSGLLLCACEQGVVAKSVNITKKR